PTAPTPCPSARSPTPPNRARLRRGQLGNGRNSPSSYNPTLGPPPLLVATRLADRYPGAFILAGADIRRFAQDRRSLTTTLVFGVIGGALVSLADALLFPSLILAVFVAQLTDDPVTIGLVPAI